MSEMKLVAQVWRNSSYTLAILFIVSQIIHCSFARGVKSPQASPKSKLTPDEFSSTVLADDTPQHFEGRQMPQETDPVVVQEETTRAEKQLKASAYHVRQEWRQSEVAYGQVVGVALDSSGDVIIFHRGERKWDGSTFNGHILRDQINPISQPTLLQLDKGTGQVKNKWGEDFFFMPHGLSVDTNDNIWVTDVGLHQVFKFPAGYGPGQSQLTLGTRFETGSDRNHFCKPTGVAVTSAGEIFVSDGYCNSRIVKFSADGNFLLEFGNEANNGFGGFAIFSSSPGSFNVPHALSLAEDKGEVCVADRENGEIKCFTIAEGNLSRQFDLDGWGSRLYSVSYTPAFGGKLFAVNGKEFFNSPKIQVFEIDYATGQVDGAFSPENKGLSNPHDVAVSADGTEVYVAEIGPNILWKFELDKNAPLPHVQQPSLFQRVSSVLSFELF